MFVNRGSFVGGAERVLLTIASSLSAIGYKPLLTCPEDGELAATARARSIPVEGWLFNRMRITYNPIELAGYVPALWRGGLHVRRYAAASGAHLIHAHHPVTVLYSIRAARSLRVPLILHMHDGQIMRPLYRETLRVAARFADRIICVSETARERVQSVSTDLKKVTVIHNGIDQAILDAPYEPTDQVTGPGPHIGIFGVIEPRKGHHIFLSAAASLAQRYPTAQFWIVGPETHADKAGYRKQLAERASTPPLAGRTHFTGFRADVSRWIQAMDLVVMPSVDMKSFGLAAAEAMALGRLVVASGAGGLTEIIRDGDTGRLVPPGDAAALAAMIGEMLTNRPAGMGERAAADIRSRFSPETFIRRIGAVYDDVLDGWKR